MPVQISWHPTLPVLIATYSGLLLSREHREMVKGRKQLLDGVPGKVYLLADTRQLEGVEDIYTLAAQENIFKHRRIHRTLIVLKPSVYRSNLVAIRDTFTLDLPVLFFADFDEAITYIQQLAGE